MELRDFLFAPIKDQKFQFAMSVQEKGILSGTEELAALLRQLNLSAEILMPEGAALKPGAVVLRGSDTPEKIARAEEMLLGVVGKASGVATAASQFVERSKGQLKIVCGAWKKIDNPIRAPLRKAIAAGGAGIRISDSPFVYLDKNLVRMFGGVRESVMRAKAFDSARAIVVQLRGELQPIVQEAEDAIQAGANILMVDTGNLSDLQILADSMIKERREKVKIAFAGGVTLDFLPDLIAAQVNIVDVGRSIIDAPMLDFRLDVEV